MNTNINSTPMSHSIMHGDKLLTEEQSFLVFRLGDQDYGIDIRTVQELRHYSMLARVAQGSRLINGVAISRGVIMPLVDMRIHVSCGAAPLYDNLTDVVILDIAGRSICMVVDSVSDVIRLNLEKIQPLPPTRLALDTNYLIGFAEYEQRSLILVDINAVMLGPATESQHSKTVCLNS